MVEFAADVGDVPPEDLEIAGISLGTPTSLDDLGGGDGVVRVAEENGQDLCFAVSEGDFKASDAQDGTDGVKFELAGDDEVSLRKALMGHLRHLYEGRCISLGSNFVTMIEKPQRRFARCL